MKMRVLVRRDLPAEQRLVQALHAAVELTAVCSRKTDQAFEEWEELHKTVVVLGVQDQAELLHWRELLDACGAAYACFRESHTGEYTALAVHPQMGSAFFRGLTLL